MIAIVALMVPVALALPGGSPNTDSGQSNGANKMAAASGDVAIFTASPLGLDGGVEILTTSIKTGGPTDLLFQVSLECSIWTDVYSTTITERQDSLGYIGEAEARVIVWLEMGNGVTWERVDLGDLDGEVTFCDRIHRQEISETDDSTGNWTLRQFIKTKTANAFNWFTFDVGSGVHDIRVMARLETDATTGSEAHAGIGSATLVVEPVRFPQGAGFA